MISSKESSSLHFLFNSLIKHQQRKFILLFALLVVNGFFSFIVYRRCCVNEMANKPKTVDQLHTELCQISPSDTRLKNIFLPQSQKCILKFSFIICNLKSRWFKRIFSLRNCSSSGLCMLKDPFLWKKIENMGKE